MQNFKHGRECEETCTYDFDNYSNDDDIIEYIWYLIKSKTELNSIKGLFKSVKYDPDKNSFKYIGHIINKEKYFDGGYDGDISSDDESCKNININTNKVDYNWLDERDGDIDDEYKRGVKYFDGYAGFIEMFYIFPYLMQNDDKFRQLIRNTIKINDDICKIKSTMGITGKIWFKHMFNILMNKHREKINVNIDINDYFSFV